MNEPRHIVDELADTTPIQHLDFDAPCGHHNCQQPADYTLWRVQCCPAVRLIYLMCAGHHAIIAALPMISCASCNTLFTPSLAAFYRIEPIRHKEAT
jgi:hypothetical protein